MEFNNRNSHWIDAHTKQYEKSFKKIDLFDRKSEYWRFAPPSIWHDKYFNNELSQDKKKLSLSVNNNGITESFIRFKDGILDFDSLTKFKQSEKNIEVSSYNDAVRDENHWSRLKFGLAQLNAEKPYERPLAVFNGFNVVDGVFIKFKKGTKKKIHIFYEGNEHKHESLKPKHINIKDLL